MPLSKDPAKAEKSKANLSKGGAQDAVRKYGESLLKIAEQGKPSEKIQLKISRKQLKDYALWYLENRGGVGASKEYKPEYAKKLLDFFKEKCKERFTLVEKIVYDRKGNALTDPSGQPLKDKVMVANMPPYLVDFATEIGVMVGTLNDWSRAYSEFAEACAHAKEIRSKFIVDNGLAGLYDPQSWIFTAKNLAGMKDKTDVTSDDKPIMNVSLQRFDNPAESDVVQAQADTKRSNVPPMLR